MFLQLRKETRNDYSFQKLKFLCNRRFLCYIFFICNIMNIIVLEKNTKLLFYKILIF